MRGVVGWVAIAALGCQRTGGGTAPAPSASAAASAVPSAPAAEPYRGIAPIALPLGYGTKAFAPKRMQRVADPHWPKGSHLKLDDSFVFELGMGSGLDGLNVTTLAANRRARHIWQDEGDAGRTFHQIEFSVSPEELQRLASLLDSEKLLEQPMEVSAPDVRDGAQWIVFVRSEGKDKYVSLSNAFPEPFFRIARFVSREIVDARSSLAEHAPTLPPGGEHDDHLWNGFADYADRERGLPPHVVARLSCGGPCPAPSRVATRLVDATSGRRGKLDVQSAKDSPPLVWAPYDPKRIDGHHDYQLEITLTAAGKAYTTVPIPVITKGYPFVLDVDLAPRETPR